MNKLIGILAFLILLSGGLYLSLRLRPEWTPSWNFDFLPQKESTQTHPLSESYEALLDSIGQLNLAIRQETDGRALLAHKERQTYFWAQIQQVRSQAEAKGTKPDSASEMAELMELLTRVLIITVAVLGILALLLFLMLRRKRRVLTRKLEALKKDPRFREPVKGFGQGKGSPPSPTAEEKELHIRQQEAITRALAALDPTTASPRARPGATDNGKKVVVRERVTRALQGLAEALSALKAPIADPAVAEKTKTPKTKAMSQNVLQPTHGLETGDATEMGSILPEPPEALQPSRFEREREEKSDIVRLARRGYTSSEIARRLRLPQDQVELVIRLQRESGDKN